MSSHELTPEEQEIIDLLEEALTQFNKLPNHRAYDQDDFARTLRMAENIVYARVVDREVDDDDPSPPPPKSTPKKQNRRSPNTSFLNLGRVW
jgi:hypothetical protein